MGRVQRPHEIVDRRQRDHLPGLTEATRETGEGRDQILSVRRRLEDESLGTGSSMLAMSLAHLGIVDISKSCDLKHSVLDANALLLIRKGDDLAVAAVGDERVASLAGPL